MSHVRDGIRHTYTSRLRGVEAAVGIELGARLPAGPLEDFLTARWGLHIQRAGRTWYLPNEHPPWILHSAKVTSLDADALLKSVGLVPPKRPPDHVAFSAGVPAVFGLPFNPSGQRSPGR